MEFHCYLYHHVEFKATSKEQSPTKALLKGSGMSLKPYTVMRTNIYITSKNAFELISVVASN